MDGEGHKIFIFIAQVFQREGQRRLTLPSKLSRTPNFSPLIRFSKELPLRR